MPRKPLIIHPFLLAIYPFLFFFANNAGAIAPGALILPLVTTICSAALLWALLKLILKDAERPAAMTSLSLIMFFSYSHVKCLLEAIVRTNLLLPMFWLVIALAGFIFIVRFREKAGKITHFLNVVSVILVIFPILAIGRYGIEMSAFRGSDEGPVVKDGARLKANNPNIYYIVVDAYAGRKELNEIYGYDNSGFLGFLAKKGFYVAGDSRSNYCQTGLSLASSLNLKYLDSILANVSVTSDNPGLISLAIKHNEVFDFLKKRGYTIVSFASGRPETEIDNADIYISGGADFESSKSAVANITPLAAVLSIFAEDPRAGISRKRILYTLDHIPDTVKLKGPLFVFAHIELPHPPFIFGPNGEEMRMTGEFTDYDGNWLIKEGRLTRDEYVKAYARQLEFLNKKLTAVIDSLLSRSKEKPIIILQSDHGPRSRLVWEDPSRTDLKEAVSILNTYYFPGGNYRNLYSSISPVNTFRVILNQFFSADYGPLRDDSYFSTARYPYQFINVSDKVE